MPTLAIADSVSHPPICYMTSLVRACLTFYVEFYRSDIPVKDDISLKNEPKIKVENNKFPCRIDTFKTGQS